MRLGIDFGTTNSAVALYDGHTLTAVQVDLQSDTPQILPSLIYITREHDHYLGTTAMQTYAERETGRPVRWKRHYIGEFEVMVGGPGSGPIVFMQDAYAWSDEGAQGRLLQSVKTALRDGTYQGTRIFDRFYTLDEFLVKLLRELREQSEAFLGQPCTEVVIGRPVHFSPNPDIDRRAEQILHKAARGAGFRQVYFQAEPMGATYLHHINSSTRQRLLVFDFGGGTLDFTVADVGGDDMPDILSTHGVLVGGDDLDRRIMQYLLKYFGEAVKIGRELFPYEILDKLLNWQTQPEISRPEYREILYDFKTKSTNPTAIACVEALVSNNLGFALFKEIERVKKELSRNEAAELRFDHDPIHIHEVITRHHFERMIAPEVELVAEGLDVALAKAGVTADEIDIVARTGGSSQIPIFVQMLSDKFGAEKILAMHPLASIVGGLGIIAHHQRGVYPSYAHRHVTEAEFDLVVTHIAGPTDGYEPYLLQVGKYCYSDQETTLYKIPVELSRLPAIRVVQSDYSLELDEHLRFVLQRPSWVYVAYTATATALPHWLRDFEETDFDIQTNDPWVKGKWFKVYRKGYDAGAVVLGSTRADGYWGKVGLHYLVVIEPMS